MRIQDVIAAINGKESDEVMTATWARLERQYLSDVE